MSSRQFYWKPTIFFYISKEGIQNTGSFLLTLMHCFVVAPAGVSFKAYVCPGASFLSILNHSWEVAIWPVQDHWALRFSNYICFFHPNYLSNCLLKPFPWVARIHFYKWKLFTQPQHDKSLCFTCFLPRLHCKALLKFTKLWKLSDNPASLFVIIREIQSWLNESCFVYYY